MFWTKKRRNSKQQPAKQAEPNEPPVSDAAASPPVEPAQQLDLALDALADLLRAYGDKAFDTNHASADQTREACDKWARHLLVGTAAIPAHEVTETSESETTTPEPVDRDFRSLVRLGTDHRTRECQYVEQSLDDLQQAVWSFVHALRSAITLDRNADHTTSGRLSRLSAAVNSSSPSRIRREAAECVRVVGELIQERRERQEGQINTLGRRLESMRSELESVREQTTRDALTGIYNRAAFDEQLEKIADLDFLVDHGAFLFMMDIDHFKWVNDTHGHPCGDDVLKRVARALSHCFKRQDDFVARYGGEEFSALVRAPSLEIAEMLSERVMFDVRDLEIENNGERLRVTISIGIAALRKGEDGSSWLKRADDALYRAKEGGRDRAVIADREALVAAAKEA